VVVLEKTNARYVESMPEPISLVTIDASFISLKILLPVVKGWLAEPPAPLPISGEGSQSGGSVIALIKPQFEAGRKESAKHKGVIRAPAIHKEVLVDVLTFALGEGFGVRGLLRSPVLGPKGNIEFLTWLDVGKAEKTDLDGMVCRELEQ
jgi:23S rRNA (cytidine1920-2'-O)/16S rRNA (cytidine1409-2'-O)-methyltransferase